MHFGHKGPIQLIFMRENPRGVVKMSNVIFVIGFMLLIMPPIMWLIFELRPTDWR